MESSKTEEITEIWGKVIENELARQEEEKSDNAKWLQQKHPKVYELVLHETSKTIIKILMFIEEINVEKTK